MLQTFSPPPGVQAECCARKEENVSQGLIGLPDVMLPLTLRLGKED